MSSPAAGWAFNDYRTRTNNCKKRPIPHAAGGQVERGLAWDCLLKALHHVFDYLPLVNPYTSNVYTIHNYYRLVHQQQR